MQDSPNTSDSDSEGLDASMEIQSADDSLYIPTPERVVREKIKNIAVVPLKVCFMDLRQLDKFMKQLNEVCVCVPLPAVRGNSLS